jgi:hypothetical protein
VLIEKLESRREYSPSLAAGSFNVEKVAEERPGPQFSERLFAGHGTDVFGGAIVRGDKSDGLI